MPKYLKYVFLLFLVFVFIGCGEKEEVNSYSVTFIVDEKVEVVKVGENEKVSKPSDPVKEGFIFSGWFIEDNLYDFNEEVTKDISLTARFDNVITKIEAETESYIFYLNEVNLTDISNKGYIYSGSEKEEVVINYDYSNVDTEKEGSYKVKGSIDIKDGYVLSSDILNEVYITVTIKPERALIKEILKRDDYSCYVGAKTTDVIPNRCRAVLENGEIVLVRCKWDFTTVNFNEVGEYVIEGVVTVPGEYKLDEGISLNTSMNITVKDYGFYIDERNTKRRVEHYIQDTICLELCNSNGIIEKFENIKDVEELVDLKWHVSNSEKVYQCEYIENFGHGKNADIRILYYLNILDYVDEINVYAEFTYKNVNIVTNTLTFKVEEKAYEGIDPDVITILCDKNDVKYLNSLDENFVYRDNIDKSFNIIWSDSYTSVEPVSNIKFVTYPNDVKTREERINYIINQYRNKTMNFQCIFDDVSMIEEIIKIEPNLLKEFTGTNKTYLGFSDLVANIWDLVDCNNKRYGLLFNRYHEDMNQYLGLFYNNNKFKSYEIDDLTLDDSSMESFKNWVKDAVTKLDGDISLLNNDIEKFTKMVVNWCGYKTKECPENVLQEVFAFIKELNNLGCFGENAIINYEYDDECNSYFKLELNEKKYMAVKDKKAFFFTEFKNNISFYSGQDTIPLNIQYMYNFDMGSQSFIHHLYTNEDIVKEHLIENGITNELSINILLNNEIHKTVTPCILYDGKEFIYSSMLKDYLEGSKTTYINL